MANKQSPQTASPAIKAMDLDATNPKRAEHQNGLLTTIFDSAPSIMLFVDREGRTIDINEAGIKFAGKPKSQLLGLFGGEVFGCVDAFQGLGCTKNPECAVCPILSRVTKTFGTGEPLRNEEGEVKISRKGVTITVHLLISTTLINTSPGAQVLISVTDITRLKQSEMKLLQSEAELKMAQQAAHLGSWVWHVKTGTLEWSDEMYRIFGIEKDKFTGNLSDVIKKAIHPDDKAAVEAANLKVIRERQSFPLEYRVVHPGGEIRWVWAESGKIVLGKSGESDTLHGYVQDITDRKLGEERINRSSFEWRTTFDSIRDKISIQDRNFKILRVNKAYADGVGMPIKEVIGKTCYEIVHCSDAPITGCPHQKTLTSGKQSVLEIEDEAKSVCSEVCTFPVFDESGKIISSVHIVHDITARKKAEQEARQLRDKAEMSSRLAAVGEMAAGIAHEINNPLTGVIGFSELLLQRSDLPDDAREELKIIFDGSQRVKEIVRRMLTFARQTKPQKNDINLNEIIENTLELRSYVLRTANIEAVTDFDPDLPWIFGDSGQIQQVILNLIVNAEYAMKKAHGRGNLIIKTEQVDHCVRISIKDDGPGLPDEAKIKLFQPFFTTKPPGEGTGLGLALSLGIVKEHGGSITVEGAPGLGATFVVQLPIMTCDQYIAVEDDFQEIQVPTKKATILVVDDEPSVRSLIQVMLTKIGHKVDESDSFEKALEHLAVRSYDLVFLDVRMPRMSGTELYKEITNRWPELVGRIIFITGDTSDEATKEYLTKHQVPFVSKPFDRKTLEDTMALILNAQN